MNDALRELRQRHIEAAVDALRKNRFEAEYVEGPEELIKRLGEKIPAGSSCSLGGSMTIDYAGVRDWLEKRSDINYLDRYAKGADTDRVFHDALSCDVYLTGTNAVTMQGELYNVDGTGNRVAALCFGPKRVIVIAGFNKIVGNLEEAKIRMRSIAAPANALRLKRKTPCAATGRCQDCASEDRLCSQYLVTGWQRSPGRICVYIMGGEYGN
ncbi:MAG: lactate utilization protein [Oscillospiraceae bacterium]|jgi:hypothetical protein|nr:lactate utilization protein [Oscillospiraceae bacterium]